MIKKRVVKIFISSPGDVAAEREHAIAQVNLLNMDPEVSSTLECEAMIYEPAPNRVGLRPQDIINRYVGRSSQADIVVCIFGRRFGQATPIGGHVYESGTYFEFKDAEQAQRRNLAGRPIILLYHLLKEPPVEESSDQIEQNEKVKAFFNEFRGQDAIYQGYIRERKSEEFFAQFFTELKSVIQEEFLPQKRDARRIILRRVRDTWISGVLNDITARVAAPFDVPIRKNDGTILVPSRRDTRLNRRGASSLVDIFLDENNQLLILGSAGMGKTFIMLELVRSLLDRAEGDVNLPIPVVFNLSSWGSERKPLKEWLKSQLAVVYRMPKDVADDLIENEKICVCLDGLDEITIGGYGSEEEKKTEQKLCQRECLNAINKYLKKSEIHVILCCRKDEFLALETKFVCRGEVPSIHLEPLSDAQVAAYLNASKYELSVLREALEQDEILREMARTPFLLTTMSVAYRDGQDTNLTQILRVGINLTDRQQRRDARRDHLLAKYVRSRYHNYVPNREDMPQYFETNSTLRGLVARYVFRRAQNDGQIYVENSDQEREIHSNTLDYSLDDIRCFMGMLARKMEEKGEGKQLLVEQLQPSWLPNKHAYRMYLATTGALLSGFIALVVGFPMGVALGYEREYVYHNVFFGFIHGLATFGIASSIAGGIVAVAYALTDGWGFGVGLGTALGATRGTTTALSSVDPKGMHLGIRNGLITTFVGVCVLGPLMNTRNHRRDRIRPLVVASAWNWPKAAIGLASAFFVSFIFRIFFDAGRALAFGIALAPMLFTLFGNLGTGFEINTYPNQGIWQSLYLAIRTGCSCAVFGLCSFGVCYAGFLHDLNQGIVNGILGLGCAVVSLGFGVIPVIQHISLRLLLTRYKIIPFDYVHFLDECSKMQLLRRVGGSYIFQHEELRVFFRNCSVGQAYAVTSSAGG